MYSLNAKEEMVTEQMVVGFFSPLEAKVSFWWSKLPHTPPYLRQGHEQPGPHHYEVEPPDSP